jgi:hypothetical protein
MDYFSRHAMGLSEFLGTLPPVILHFGNNFGDSNLCIEMPLISHCCLFPLLRLLMIAYICILVKVLSW